MDRNSAGLYLLVITIAEVEDGIARSRRAGAHAKAKRLMDWVETVLHLYASRVLPIDVATARRIGALADHARGQGCDPGLADLAIAATAMNRGCVVLTRNLRHSAPLGAPVRDPSEALPGDVRPWPPAAMGVLRNFGGTTPLPTPLEADVPWFSSADREGWEVAGALRGTAMQRC